LHACQIVAGWSYEDWNGPVYPVTKPKGFDPLTYLACYYDTIEVNSTFYRPASSNAGRSWARRVSHNRNFKFTAKLWQRFTHERGEAWESHDVDQVKEGMDPLAEQGRLGCVLAQFPWSFKRSPESEEWLGDLTAAFSDFPMAIEVRHSSWNVPDFYRWLGEQEVGAVNIDQPLFRDSIKPDAIVTSPVGYVRLHGRNYENWFRENVESHERYDYLYTAEELRAWLDLIHRVAERAHETYVVTNNHYRGQAPANASMLKKLYGADDVEVPPELAHTYAHVLEPLGIRAIGAHGELELGI
jgi:uncharacterized protein YecE (DUF72 family)